MPRKYVVVSGGVISGIGKGVIASSTGLLLKTYGLTVTSIKIDPYLNIDAGTLSPLDHGRFVCNVVEPRRPISYFFVYIYAIGFRTRKKTKKKIYIKKKEVNRLNSAVRLKKLNASP